MLFILIYLSVSVIFHVLIFSTKKDISIIWNISHVTYVCWISFHLSYLRGYSNWNFAMLLKNISVTPLYSFSFRNFFDIHLNTFIGLISFPFPFLCLNDIINYLTLERRRELLRPKFQNHFNSLSVEVRCLIMPSR